MPDGLPGPAREPVAVAAGAADVPIGRLQDFYELPGVPTDAGPFRVQRLLRLLSLILYGADRPLRVVDVGCGDGEATRSIADLAASMTAGHEVAGGDWAQGPLRRAQDRGLTVFRGTLESPGLPLATESVDVIVLNEVIEHLVDTDAAVAELRRVLRPGGHLLLSTPNLAAWFNRIALLLGIQPVFSEVSLRRVFGRPGSVVAGHLHLFTRRALVEFLEANGFRDVRISGACYHDTPKPLRPVDRALRHVPSMAAILMCSARKP
jgi:SAM-dependent methyltransferase